jgi:hypothetical protein
MAAAHANRRWWLRVEATHGRCAWESCALKPQGSRPSCSHATCSSCCATAAAAAASAACSRPAFSSAATSRVATEMVCCKAGEGREGREGPRGPRGPRGELRGSASSAVAGGDGWPDGGGKGGNMVATWWQHGGKLVGGSWRAGIEADGRRGAGKGMCLGVSGPGAGRARRGWSHVAAAERRAHLLHVFCEQAARVANVDGRLHFVAWGGTQAYELSRLHNKQSSPQPWPSHQPRPPVRTCQLNARPRKPRAKAKAKAKSKKAMQSKRAAEHALHRLRRRRPAHP